MALPGAILGLSAVLSGKHHEESAAAAVSSKAGFIKREDFLDFLGNYREAAFWVVQLLSQQVTSALEHICRIEPLPSDEPLQ